MFTIDTKDSKNINEFIDNILSETKKEVAVELDRRLARRSPVDEGTFRANWTFKAAQGNAYDEKEYDVTTRTQNRSAEGLKIKSLKVNDVLVSNNLPYAARLNDGWSEQAPKKFVELAITEALNKVFK